MRVLFFFLGGASSTIKGTKKAKEAAKATLKGVSVSFTLVLIRILLTYTTGPHS
jgi:hypothetical protein